MKTGYKTVLTDELKEITPSQAGKIAEEFIINWLSNRDKKTYVARFSDTYDANKGRWGNPTQKKVILPRKPCDIMLIMNGETYFCEIKTSTSKRGLTPSLFKQQVSERTRIVKAGGKYIYLIYSADRKKWYFIPYPDLIDDDTWEDLIDFYIDFPEVKF